ncbi:hypothetical protein ACIQPQ_34465 [Streptomyces sp. NPDC091281]|uniref:hypothetical protein n=1 Tax=Streptomyces sp. NPDC091281 TaxID=3365985 RepID=UPI0037FD08E3
MTAPDDPRFEWIDVSDLGGPVTWMRGACRHRRPVEFRSVVDDELLAHLCLDCDEQLDVTPKPVLSPIGEP